MRTDGILQFIFGRRFESKDDDPLQEGQDEDEEEQAFHIMVKVRHNGEVGGGEGSRGSKEI